ncbi:MarR family winged helix-turn-helix transcriptional regulator [Bradyrhizobium vignae]|uniref:Transcriptional regulator (Modular protein) n=1 Tax=Bradyrhizobium vignae TaxID=1549949 RepID=A0A2U3PV92_9BRAD|nr:MarR family transcriptional regulator [Bradyrhizobium vignae]SPP93072.1 Transcriptional regulator (modular protein) [Bradyrhizobium vignae]
MQKDLAVMVQSDEPVSWMDALGSSNEGESDLPQSRTSLDQLSWEITSISVYLKEIREIWAREIEISHPQWMILMALSKLAEGEGMAVNMVAKALHIESAFVTTQSKELERRGLLCRRSSSEDARVVQLSLSDKACKHLESLAERQAALDEYIFAGFTDPDLSSFLVRLSDLKTRIGKARFRAGLEC